MRRLIILIRDLFDTPLSRTEARRRLLCLALDKNER